MAREWNVDLDVALEIRAELQEQEKRYRDRAVKLHDKAVEMGSAYASYSRYEQESQYNQGNANGIREALRAYGERGL